MKLNTEELLDPTDIEDLGLGKKTTAHNDMGQRSKQRLTHWMTFTPTTQRDTPEWEGGDVVEVVEWEGDNFF